MAEWTPYDTPLDNLVASFSLSHARPHTFYQSCHMPGNAMHAVRLVPFPMPCELHMHAELAIEPFWSLYDTYQKRSVQSTSRRLAGLPAPIGPHGVPRGSETNSG